MASEERRNADRVVSKLVNKRMRALCLEGQKRLMQKTPVRSGRAKANWNVSTGSADGSVDEGATSSAPHGQVDPAKFAEGMAVIAGTDFFERDEHLFIANGLDYIEALEDGHSGQASGGMVALTVEELRGTAASISRGL